MNQTVPSLSNLVYGTNLSTVQVRVTRLSILVNRSTNEPYSLNLQLLDNKVYMQAVNSSPLFAIGKHNFSQEAPTPSNSNSSLSSNSNSNDSEYEVDELWDRFKSSRGSHLALFTREIRHPLPFGDRITGHGLFRRFVIDPDNKDTILAFP